MTEYNWNAFNDAEFSSLLRNAEGRNELERAMYLEAARRIDERAAAVRQEREACAEMCDKITNAYSIDLLSERNASCGSVACAAAIRARSASEDAQ